MPQRTAAHLVDRVLPEVPVRQWVLSLPFALHYRLAYDAPLVTAVLGVFARALFASLRRRARARWGVARGQCGAVTFVERFGDALNLKVHFHSLLLDGVYAVDGALGAPRRRTGSRAGGLPSEPRATAREVAGSGSPREVLMSADLQELRRVLSELLADHEDAFERSQWPWETHRWYQLVYSIMAAVEGQRHPENVSNAALRALLELELLDADRLGAPSWPEEDAPLMEQVLVRKGFERGDAQTIMSALRPLALWVHATWDGRIQRYLRQLGNELIDRVTSELPLKELKHEQASLAVTHWLQDVLDLPVLVDSPALAALLKRTGCERSDALSVLDELDANAALADDILVGSSGGPGPDDDLSEADE